jgi:hypothetical protein
VKLEKSTEERVSILEYEMGEAKKDIDSLGKKVEGMATKDDLLELKSFFYQRDKDYTKNMWKVIFGLLILLSLLVAAAFGIQNIPKLW